MNECKNCEALNNAVNNLMSSGEAIETQRRKLLEERDALKSQLALAEKALEFLLDGHCEHEDTRQGSNRKWCFGCNSWIYDSDVASLEQAKETLKQIRGEG